MRGCVVAVAVALVVSLPLVASAAEFEEFPQFRYSSGLPGGGYGVTPEGGVGFNGALQMNIPVAYTPSSGNYTVSAVSAATNGGVELGMAGPDVNGTLTVGLGFGPPEAGLYVGLMATGKGDWGEQAHNVQYQLLRETAKRPAVAVGVVDVFDMRPAKQSEIFEPGGRSFYVAATRRAGSASHPLYYTLGFGNGRFNNRPFGGVSYQVTNRVKASAEYDGWNPNVGAAWDFVRHDDLHGLLNIGVVDMNRLTVGVTLTHSNN